MVYHGKHQFSMGKPVNHLFLLETSQFIMVYHGKSIQTPSTFHPGSPGLRFTVQRPGHVSMKRLASCVFCVRIAASTACEQSASSNGSESCSIRAKVRSTWGSQSSTEVILTIKYAYVYTILYNIYIYNICVCMCVYNICMMYICVLIGFIH